MDSIFRRFSQKSAQLLGSSWAFILALLLIIGWLLSGPLFGFSNTWQLIINTTTTIITFLMVFLIQNTQNRDAKAMHLKLDELIHGLKRARNSMVDIEDASDEELAHLEQEFQDLKKQYNKQHPD